MTAPTLGAIAMVVAARPLSANRGRQSPTFTRTIQTAAIAQGARILTGHLYVRITWFQRERAQGDVDNIAKLILDSLKGVVIQDDDEVMRCLAQKTVADPAGNYLYEAVRISSARVRSELEALLGAQAHVLYIEVGQISNPIVSFGPVI